MLRVSCTLASSTWNALVADLKVGLEVARTRLGDRVERRDEHRAVATARAAPLELRRHVGMATERLGVRRRHALAGRHPAVQRRPDENYSPADTAAWGRRPAGTLECQPLRRTVLG